MVKGVLSFVFVAAAQKPGSQIPENHPTLAWSSCNSSGCQSQDGLVTIDAKWRWIHESSGTTNCYIQDQWTCPDAETCTAKCVVEGVDGHEYEEIYGVKASGNTLELGFVTHGPYQTNIASRTYLMENDQSYKLFHLKNQEFTYTVDDSKIGRGVNGAMYFAQMDADGGKSKYGNAGAQYGLGYCDAQCPQDLQFINGEANVEGKYGSCCTEIDIWDADSIRTAYTMHACSTPGQTRCEGVDCGDGPDRFKGVCDKNGCDINAYRLGNKTFWGPGSDFTIDSTKPVTVTTQFITDDGTDAGKLVEVKQFYTQNGLIIEHPAYIVNGHPHEDITDDYCKDWAAETQDGTNFEEKGGLGAVEKAIESGVVLVMSISGDENTNDADSHVIFSDIKFGPIGSTIARDTVVV